MTSESCIRAKSSIMVSRCLFHRSIDIICLDAIFERGQSLAAELQCVNINRFWIKRVSGTRISSRHEICVAEVRVEGDETNV